MNPARFPFVRVERIVENAFVLFQQGIQHPADFVRLVLIRHDRSERERTHRPAEFEPLSEYEPRNRGFGPRFRMMNHIRQYLRRNRDVVRLQRGQTASSGGRTIARLPLGYHRRLPTRFRLRFSKCELNMERRFRPRVRLRFLRAIKPAFRTARFPGGFSLNPPRSPVYFPPFETHQETLVPPRTRKGPLWA